MPRWDRVKASFFDGELLADSFPRLLDAFVLDVMIFLWTTPFILLAAMLIAIARNTRAPSLFPVRIFAIAYTDIMRGVPVILWIYLIGFGVPGIGRSEQLPVVEARPKTGRNRLVLLRSVIMAEPEIG